MSTPLLFSPFLLPSPAGSLPLANRLVVAPMCQYASADGLANDWHLTHWTNLLNCGAGLVTIEATAVLAEGRISPGCLGLWCDRTEAALATHLHRARAQAPANVRVCLQLAHAGRKGSSARPWEGGALLTTDEGGWVTHAPSAVPHLPHEVPPYAMTEADLDRVEAAFVASAQRAARMGIDALELHAAHGYLLHQFLSPLANHRTDAWGGSYEGRTAYPTRVFCALRRAFDGPLGVRVSATDWVPGGWTVEDTSRWGATLKAMGADFVHVSSGGVSPLQHIPLGPGYQLPLARQVREASGLTTFGVGLITEPAQAEAALQRGDADLVALARAFLYNPRWGWHAAATLGGTVEAMPAYWRCLPKEAQAAFGPMRIGAR
jgi:2,4-dienoyl-CoA reductase-like NADH-dependent reductase (Old Yellow Enzyme family)